MLSESEYKILSGDLRQFPILAAASAAIKRCGTCTHANASPNTILRAAVLRLQYKPEFIAYVKQTAGIPAIIGGVMFKEN